MQLNREIDHENVVALKEVMLEDKSIYMVFEYAEHDFLVRLTFPGRDPLTSSYPAASYTSPCADPAYADTHLRAQITHTSAS